jgi:nucleoside phosphorylase
MPPSKTQGVGALALIERMNSLNLREREVVDNFLPEGQEGRFQSRVPVSLGVITALEIEFISMEKALLAATESVTSRLVRYASAVHSPVTIKIFEMKKNDIIIRIALTQALRMGNNSAAVAATSLVYEFPEITDLVMVGIAGGIPSPLDGTMSDRKLIESHVRLGDIFVADVPIIQYDNIKRNEGSDTNRAVPVSISPRIERTFQELRRKELGKLYPWEKCAEFIVKDMGREWIRPPRSTDTPVLYVNADNDVRATRSGLIHHPVRQPRRRRDKPLVHFGRIGSANTLLKDPRFRDRLRTDFGIRAVEMEGSGVADASWNFGIGYAVVRGICDYCDPEKPDIWQKYAAVVAAAYCRSVINELLEEECLRQGQRDASR